MNFVQLQTAGPSNKDIFRTKKGYPVSEPYVVHESTVVPAFLLNHVFGFTLGCWTAASQTTPPRSPLNSRWQSFRSSGKRGTGKRRASCPGLGLAVCSLPVPEIEILSLTDSWVAVNKPPGMLVHRTKLYHTNPNDTYLVDHVTQVVSERNSFPVAVKPIQRLDRPTSGVMLFAIGDSANAARLQATLQSPDTEKIYWAIASGADMPEQWVNEHPLSDLTGKNRKRREARTEIRQLERLSTSDMSIISARIRTGRRNQIRRHLSNSHHPILGDTSYGKGEVNRRARNLFGVKRCCLHAWCLTFKDPVAEELVRVEAAIPDDLLRVLQHFPDFDSDCVKSAWKATWSAT